MIKNFVLSKASVHGLEKDVASKSFSSILHQLYLRKMNSHLSVFRYKVIDQKLKDLAIGNMFGHWYSRDLRARFLGWRDQAKKASTVIEVNEGGPIVEEVLQQQLKWTNLIKFMKDQGYTDKEIEEFV